MTLADYMPPPIGLDGRARGGESRERPISTHGKSKHEYTPYKARNKLNIKPNHAKDLFESSPTSYKHPHIHSTRDEFIVDETRQSSANVNENYITPEAFYDMQRQMFEMKQKLDQMEQKKNQIQPQHQQEEKEEEEHFESIKKKKKKKYNQE